MNKLIITALSIILIGSIFVIYSQHQSISKSDIFRDCVNTSYVSYRTIVDSYDDPPIDYETKDKLDKKLENDMTVCFND